MPDNGLKPTLEQARAELGDLMNHSLRGHFGKIGRAATADRHNMPAIPGKGGR